MGRGCLGPSWGHLPQKEVPEGTHLLGQPPPPHQPRAPLQSIANCVFQETLPLVLLLTLLLDFSFKNNIFPNPCLKYPRSETQLEG